MKDKKSKTTRVLCATEPVLNNPSTKALPTSEVQPGYPKLIA